MQYPQCIRKMAGCLAVIFVGLVLASCSSYSSPTAPTGDPVLDAKNYLLSSERTGKFKSIVPAAGAKLAFSLDAGLLGSAPAKRLDFYSKKPIQPDYTGPGTISSADDSISVSLTWRDGAIDYSSINSITVRHANGNPGTSVSVYAPMMSPDDNNNYWLLAKADVDGDHFSDWYAIGNPGYNQQANGVFFPTTLAELQQLDTDGLAQLDLDMNSIFGPNWRD